MHLPPTPRLARWLLATYVVAMLAVVFQPLPRAAVGSVDLGYVVVEWLHLDALITPTMVEFAWNVALFVPFTMLGSWAFPRFNWEQWVGIALVATSFIEYVQHFFLPGRSATLADLISNTLGGVAGALIAVHLTQAGERRHELQARKDAPTGALTR